MKRWMASTDGGTTYDMPVAVLNAVQWNMTRDLNEGQIFHRMRLATPLQIGGDAFAEFLSWERTGVRRCSTLYIRRERLCNGAWRVQWTGRFSPGSGEWDLDEFIFTVTPEVVDRYTCVFDLLDRRVNMLAVAPVTIYATIVPQNIEYLVCYGTGPTDDCADAAIAANGWSALGSVADPCGVAVTVDLYGRERVKTDCVDGVPVPPSGGGWILLVNDCLVDGTATYVRTPIGYPAATFAATNGGPSPEPVPPVAACDQWVYLASTVCDPLGGPMYVHYWACFTSVPYRHARPLSDVLAYMLEECPSVTIASDFFDINPVGDAPGYSAGDNYVTGRSNQVGSIHVMHCSDVADPAATDPATKLERSLGDLFKVFLAMFRCYWYIDDNDRLRIEHWSFFSASDGLDTTAGDHADLNRGNNRYKHLSDGLPKYERLVFIDAMGPDFVGNDIEYSGPCVGMEQKVDEISAGCITDVQQISDFPLTVDLDAMVLLAVLDDGVINDDGAISGVIITNAPLAKANLQDAFWRHDRQLKSGMLNGQEATFAGILPNIEQSGVRARYCCDLLDLNPNDAVITELGNVHLQARRGTIEKATIDDQQDLLEMTLRYSY